MTTQPYKLNCVLFGHALDVRAVSTFQDGTIVSGSRDKTVRVWTPNSDRKGHTESAVLKGHTNFVSAVCAIDPSEGYPKGLIVTGSNDNYICVYVLGETEPFQKFKAHENTVCCLRAGHATGTFLSSSWDISAKLWNMKNLGKPQLTFTGHTAAVWCVAELPNGLVITASADKSVIVWRRNMSKLHVLNGHTDCVRSIATINEDEFLTCANDATVRHWNATLGTCLGTFSGHENYIYGISAQPGGSLVVTASEDRSVRVWRNGTMDETIHIPAPSVWCVDLLANGDIVAGSSDGVVRIFTTDPERYASPETIETFEHAVVKDQMQAQMAIGGIDIKKLPGPSSLEAPGHQNGQTKMINDGGKVKAYSWSMGEKKWTFIGDVVGGSGGSTEASGKELYNGEEYDYIFSVDIQDGVPPLKLPYNKTEDPWTAAQKFIHRNGLSQMFLDQIANFIIKNSASVPTLQSDSRFTDPFTGANRYVPCSGVSNASQTELGETISTASSSRTIIIPPSYIPHVDYLKFEQANLSAILEKLKEFNGKRAEGENRISAEDLESAVKLASDAAVEQEQIGALKTLKTLLDWPDEIVFPSLDVARLAVLHSAINEHFCTDQLLHVATRHIKKGSLPANQMLTFRLLANMFVHKSGEQFSLLHKDEVLKALLDLQSLGSKNNQIAISTYLLNLIVAVNKSNDSQGRTKVLNVLFSIVARMNEHEAIFRALVGLGTLLVATPNSDERHELIQAVRESETALMLLRKTSENSLDFNAQNKLANCSKQIIDLIL